MQGRALTAVEDWSLPERVRIANFVIHVRPFARKVSKEKLGLCDFAEDEVGDAILMFDVISTHCVNTKLRKDFLNTVVHIHEFWPSRIHPHKYESGV